MKFLLCIAFVALLAQEASARVPTYTTPLSKFSKEWDNPRYKVCNTAEHVKYMTADEKEIIFVLNLARMDPQLFRKTILRNANQVVGVDTSSVTYFKSLDSTMRVLKPLPLLQPDSLSALSARMHAEGCGKTGYTGHVRQTPESRKATCFGGECCAYGTTGALRVILELLVDQDVESLGHRRICLGEYKKIGTGIAPHSTYGTATVLDFLRR